MKNIFIILTCLFVTSKGQNYDSLNFDPNHIVSREHLKNDLSDVIGKTPDEMSTEERNFHYFRVHDINNDQMIDGNEIASKLLQRLQFINSTEVLEDNDAWLIVTIDKALKTYDHNLNGFIELNEYKLALDTNLTKS